MRPVVDDDDPIPPTEQEIDIVFPSNTGSRFLAKWSGWDHAAPPLAGEITVTFDFEFIGTTEECTIVRTLDGDGDRLWELPDAEAAPSPALPMLTPTPVRFDEELEDRMGGTLLSAAP